MALSIKTLYSINDMVPTKTKLTLLRSLVISHLHYPAILLSGINKSLLRTLEKQLNWGVKACFNRKKYDSSSDLKIKYKILPVEYLIRYRCVAYFWRIINKEIPAFQNMNLETWNLTKNERTSNFFQHQT